MNSPHFKEKLTATKCECGCGIYRLNVSSHDGFTKEQAEIICEAVNNFIGFKELPSTETNAFDLTITYKWGDKVTYEGSTWTFEPKIGTQQHTTGYNPSFMNYWIEG